MGHCTAPFPFAHAPWAGPRPARRPGAAAPAPPPDPTRRVDEAERRSVVDLLSRHTGDGRLTLDEHGERVGRALASRTRGELDELLADLPALPPPPDPRAAERRARAVRAARFAMAAPYVSVMVLLVSIWALTGAGSFWPVWPMLGWGVPTLLGVLGARAGAEHLTPVLGRGRAA